MRSHFQINPTFKLSRNSTFSSGKTILRTGLKFLLCRLLVYTSPIICIIDERSTNIHLLIVLLYFHYSKSTTCSIDTLAFFRHLRQMYTQNNLPFHIFFHHLPVPNVYINVLTPIFCYPLISHLAIQYTCLPLHISCVFLLYLLTQCSSLKHPAHLSHNHTYSDPSPNVPY